VMATVSTAAQRKHAAVCFAIAKLLALESVKNDAVKRNARLRMAIGLRPWPPKSVNWERWQ
jgi:hypothetical protein